MEHIYEYTKREYIYINIRWRQGRIDSVYNMAANTDEGKREGLKEYFLLQ